MDACTHARFRGNVLICAVAYPIATRTENRLPANQLSRVLQSSRNSNHSPHVSRGFTISLRRPEDVLRQTKDTLEASK